MEGCPSAAKLFTGSRIWQGIGDTARCGMPGAYGPLMVRLSISLGASSSRNGQDLLDALRFLVPSTRLEPGCIGCSAWIEPDSTVHYVEEWTTEAAMKLRVTSSAFTPLLAIIEAASDPRVQFDFVAVTRGLDYVEQIRGVGSHE